MKILYETLLIPNDQIRDLNKLNGNDLVNGIIDALKNNFDKYSEYIGTSNRNTNILSDIVGSIREYGWDIDTNKYLNFISALRDKGVKLNRDEFVLGAQILQQNPNLNTSKHPYFLDKNSYSPLYKIKALSFLSGKNASKYGDNPQEAMEDIKNMSTQEEIENYLSNWQTKSGEERIEASTILDRIKKDPDEFFDTTDTTSREFIDKISKSKDLFSSDGRKAVKSLLIKLDPTGAYSSIIDDLTRESISEEIGDDRYWSKKYRSLLSLLNQEADDNIEWDKEKILDFLSDIEDELEKEGKLIKGKKSKLGNTGSKILKDYLKVPVESISAELIKYIKKLDNYRLLTDTSIVDDYLGNKSNIDKILNSTYKSKEDFDTKLNNLISRLSK